MSLDQTLFLLILTGGLYLFVSERLRIDVSAMLVLLALVLTGVLDSTRRCRVRHGRRSSSPQCS